ncbi:MAG TPA: hypothetical protein VK363_16955 [Pyrinomonadaceae bacterium]|nr:hypothetical protein [Pyrinomonadaceae bacterium]
MSREDDELPFLGEDAGASVVPRGFAPGEMVGCESCLRANAPTRMNCLYCGAAMPVTDAGNDLRRPSLRVLESWEQGFNVVIVPQGGGAANDLSVDVLSEAASLLRVEAGQLRGMREAGSPLPLVRVASREEASLVEAKLRALGWHVGIVADEELAVETQAPKRIRRLEIGADALAGWTSAEGAAEQVAWERVVLFVAGRIARKRIEVEERRGGGGRRGAEGEVIETREFHEDESVLDLYSVDAVAGWRIMAESFDYSCLGAEKRLTAAENFKRLVETLRERASRAAYDDSYRNVRAFLKFAWPLAEQTEAGSLRRIRPGRYNAEAVTSVSNETQFTRYGRLLQYFRLRELSTPT